MSKGAQEASAKTQNQENVMNLQRREEIRSLANYPSEWDGAKEYQDAMRELLAHIDTLEQTAAERVIADGSRGPTPDYTGEGSALVPPVEAPAAVMPDLPAETALGLIAIDWPNRTIDVIATAANIREWFRKNARAIPADRELGNGVGALRRFAERCAQRDHQPDEHIGTAKCVACEAEDALRANQGGAAT